MISVNVDIDDLSHAGINTCLSAHRRLDTIMDYSNSWDLAGKLVEELKIDINFEEHNSENPWMASFRDNNKNLFLENSHTPCSAVAKAVLSSYVNEENEVILPLKKICNHLKSTKNVIDMIVNGNDYHDCDNTDFPIGNKYVVTFKTEDDSYKKEMIQCLIDLN